MVRVLAVLAWGVSSVGIALIDHPIESSAAPIISVAVSSVSSGAPTGSILCRWCSWYQDDQDTNSAGEQRTYISFEGDCGDPYPCVFCESAMFPEQRELCADEVGDQPIGYHPEYPLVPDFCEVAYDPCNETFGPEVFEALAAWKEGNVPSLINAVANSDQLYFNIERESVQALGCNGRTVSLNLPVARDALFAIQVGIASHRVPTAPREAPTLNGLLTRALAGWALY